MQNIGEHCIGGYVGKNWKETTVENDDDWYFVTKTVVHCLAQNSSPKSKYIVPTRTAASDHISLEEAQRRGSKILQEAEKLYWYALNGTDNYTESSISLSKDGNLYDENGYMVQQYKLNSNKSIGNYDVHLNRFPNGTVCEKNGNSIKVKITKENINTDVRGFVYIDNVQVKTCPVFYAKSYVEAYQDYIIAGDPFEITSTRELLELNGKNSDILIKKIDEETKKPIENVNFDIKKDGELIKQVTTNNKGEASLNDIYAGKYTITETRTGEAYEISINNSKTINIKYGEDITVEFANKRKKGSLEVYKTSEDNFIQNIQFHLYGTSLIGDYIDMYAITNDKGIAKFENVLVSSNQGYTLEEVNTGIQYVVPPKLNTSIKWNEISQATINNKLKKFRVIVNKVDYETGKDFQGDGTLAGAKYGIYQNNKLVDIYTTDEKGQFTTKYYKCSNDWIMKEIEPSEGYLLDSTVYNIGTEPKDYKVEYNTLEKSVKEKIKKGKISIVKHSDNGNTQIETPEIGAEFQIYLKSAGNFNNAKLTERDILTCDENGYANTKLLPYGVYRVHQTKGWEDTEFIRDFDVYISEEGKNYKFIINNANFESYLKIVKKDKETGKIITNAGIGFQIYDSNKKLISMTYTYPKITKINTFYTNTDGFLITPEKLRSGDYYLKEVQAPYGYTLSNELIPFRVTRGNSEISEEITVIEIEKFNVAQKGKIIINKTGEKFNTVTRNDNVYQPVYNNSNLNGAKYQIIANEDICTLDGTVRAKKGTIVDTITTSDNGKAESKELYLGKYIVKEITAPDGMFINNQSYNTELTYAGQNIEVTNTSTSFYNERQKLQIHVKKSLEVDDEYDIGNNGEFLDVKFGLYAYEEITAPDESIIPKDGLIEIIGINEKGEGIFTTDLPFGKYYIQELSTNNSYVIDDTKYPVNFQYQGQEKEIVTITVNENKDIMNKIIRGKIEGIKLDKDNRKLENATIGIFKKNTSQFTNENAIKTTISNEDGSFSFVDVPFGEWIIKEIAPPREFVLSEEVFLVSINEQNKLIEIELVNEYIKGNIALTKVDKEYPDNLLVGATFVVFEDTNKNGIFDDKDKEIGNLKELQDGIYSLENLKYGQYFIKETIAPKGFILDENIYTAYITEDGKTYEIENQNGIGFINQAMVGNIKIQKTSSDGKLDGFSFLVEGTDITGHYFNQTYITNKNGEIFIQGLRIGNYTITEISNEQNKGYILPSSQIVAVEYGKIIEVKFHNKLIETPKTGDNSILAMWVSLVGVSVLILIGMGVHKYRKKIDE